MGRCDPPPVAALPDRRLRALTGYTLKRAYQRLQSDAVRVLEGFGLRISTYSALAVICDNADLRQTQLAEALMMERSNTVVVVDALEQAGLIERRRVPTDRRSYALRATRVGRRLCDEVTEALHRHETDMLAALPPEDHAALMALLRRIDGSGQGGGKDG